MFQTTGPQKRWARAPTVVASWFHKFALDYSVDGICLSAHTDVVKTERPLDLSAIRHAAKLTQVELANGLGVGQSAVSKIEAQRDVLLSTIAGYIHAAGATAQLVVTVGDTSLKFAVAPDGSPGEDRQP